MKPLWQYLALLSVHWFADFVCQTHWQASNKSKNNKALLVHVAVYTCWINLAAIFIFGKGAAIEFALVNGVLHFATDWFSSRVTSRLFMAQFDYIRSAFDNRPRMAMKRDFNPHNFFVVIGLDQYIHQATLAVTMWYFLT